jgi:hypothetical protein
MLTLFGVAALSFMMLMYALERRGNTFVLAFAVGCALSSLYGFLSGAWPFGIVEALWTGVALRRYAQGRGAVLSARVRESNLVSSRNAAHRSPSTRL